MSEILKTDLNVYIVRSLLESEIEKDSSVADRYFSFEGIHFSSGLVQDMSGENDHYLGFIEHDLMLPSDYSVSSFLDYLSYYSDKCPIRSESGGMLMLIKMTSPIEPLSYCFALVEEDC